MKRTVTLIALAAGLATGPAAAQTPLDAPVRVFPDTPADVVHVDVDLIFGTDTQSATVREVLHVLLPQDTSLRLPLPDSEVRLAWTLGSFDQGPISATDIDHRSREAPESFVLTQEDSLGVRVDSLHWSAWVADAALNLQWSNPPEDTLIVQLEYELAPGRGLLSGAWGAWTDTEPGSSWLVLPNPVTDAFSATLRIDHPVSWTAVAPGLAVSETAGQTVFALPATTVGERIPVAVGSLSRRQAGPVTIYFPDGSPATFLRHAEPMAQRWSARWPSLPDSLRLVAVDLIGPELPFETAVLAQNGFRDIVRAGKGMGLMDRAMLVDERTAAATDYDGLVAQVLGQVLNPVSVSQWTDIWVREAVACALGSSFASAGGSRDASLRMWAALADAYLLEAGVYKRPLTWDRWREYADLIDAHACGRGAWLLRYLSDEIGMPVLDQLLASDTVGADSERVFEILSSHAATSLDDVFDALVHAAGHPVIEVISEFDAADGQLSITLLQNQEGPLVPAVIPVQTGVRTTSIAGGSESFVRFREARQTLSLTMQIPPRFVQLDSAGVLLAEFDYRRDAGSWSAALTEGSDWERYRAALESGDFMEDRSAGFASRLAYASERLPLIREVLVRSTREFPGPPRLLEAALRDNDARVRIAAIEMLAERPPDDSVSRLLLGLAASDSVYAVQAAVVRALDALDAQQALQVARSALVTPSQFEVVREAGFAVLAKRADTAELARAFLEHTSGKPSSDRIRAALAAAPGLSGHRNSSRRILSLLEQPLPTVRLMTARAAGSVLLPADERDVRALAGREPVPQVRAELVRLADLLADRR